MTLQKLRDRTIMVTGGCGFIGSHLVRALVLGGAGRVIVVDSMRFGDRAHLADLAGTIEILPFTLGTDDPARLETEVARSEYLFHLAAEKHNASKDDPRAIIRSNIDGTLTLLELAAKHRIRRVLFTSSLYAYGRMSGPPFVESEVPRPRTIYGISKLCGEHLLAHFQESSGLDGIALRYLFVYGPEQFAGTGYKSVIVRNFERILGGERPTIYGDGAQALDYVYVDDVVRATIAAMESAPGGEILNVASGAATSVSDLIDTMRRVSGSAAAVSHLPPDSTAGSRRVADITRISKTLGWKPEVSLEDGLRRTWRWMVEKHDAR